MKYKKLFILCKGDSVTGVSELVHQLCHELTNLNLESYVSYYPYDTRYSIPDEYSIYNVKTAHAAALKYTEDKYVNEIFNIGTGQSISVMEIINTFSEHLNTKITFHVTKRRLGDLPVYFSKSEKAEKHLKWRAKKTLLDMRRDSLAWLQHYNK